MSGRPLRYLAENTTYHVCARFVNYEKFMEDDIYKRLLFQVVKETQKKHNFQFNAYEILDDHYHMIIKVLTGTLISIIMHSINMNFAKKLNKLYNRRGPVFNERYGSKVIEHAKNPIKYFLSLLWYLAYNSVRKGLVSDPREYLYNSIKHYLQENYLGRIKITVHEIFLNLSDQFSDRLEILLAMEKEYREILSMSY